MTTIAVPPPVRSRRPRRWFLAGLAVVIAIGLYPIGRYAWASAHYRAALQAIERRDFNDARSHLNICLNEWPASGEVQFLAARTARRSGDLDEAQLRLKEATRLGWVPEAVNLERALIAIQSGQNRNLGHTLMEFVRRGHPDAHLIVEILTPLYLNLFQLGPASESLDYWIQLEPNYDKPYLIRADLHNRMMRRTQALQDYEKAVALNPDNEEARLLYANMLVHQKFPAKAYPHYEWLMQRRPNDPQVLRGMANCLTNQGDTDRARDLLDELLRNDPNDAITMGILGQLELNSGRTERAEEVLRRAAKIMPYELSLLYLLGQVLDRNVKPEEATAVNKQMERYEALQKRSKELMEAMMRDPQNPEIRRQLAECLRDVGLEDEAKRWLESALQINPRHRRTYETLADVCLRLGDQRKSEEYSRIAKSLPEPVWWRPDL